MMVHERFGSHFEKWHLDDRTTIHHFYGPDHGHPHDHNADFYTEILIGGYMEEIYTPLPDGAWSMETVERFPGTEHHVAAECIHRIVGLPNGFAVTKVTREPERREPRFWRFDQDGHRSAAFWEPRP